MEVSDILADEVVNFGLSVLPPVLQLFAMLVAPLLRRGDVADWGVEPNEPVVTGALRDFKPEVG